MRQHKLQAYPLALVGQRGLLRVLAGLHQIRLQLRRAQLRIRQKLPDRIRVPQLQRIDLSQWPRSMHKSLQPEFGTGFSIACIPLQGVVLNEQGIAST